MNRNETLRENLVALLTGEHARMSFERAVEEFPVEKINTPFPKADYTPWHLLEHLRLAQEDILDFCRNPHYKERKWPEGYWPAKSKKATTAAWNKTINGFQKDLKDIVSIVEDAETDLYHGIPWGEGITILREIVTVANHNAFHIGEFAIMRQAMGTWGKSHKK